MCVCVLCMCAGMALHVRVNSEGVTPINPPPASTQILDLAWPTIPREQGRRHAATSCLSTRGWTQVKIRMLQNGPALPCLSLQAAVLWAWQQLRHHHRHSLPGTASRPGNHTSCSRPFLGRPHTAVILLLFPLLFLDAPQCAWSGWGNLLSVALQVAGQSRLADPIKAHQQAVQGENTHT